MFVRLVILAVFTFISGVRPDFNLVLPLTTSHNCLINIVASSSKQHIPTMYSVAIGGLLHTYTIHNVTSLNFEISDHALKNPNGINMQTGYFRLFSKYSQRRIVF